MHLCSTELATLLTADTKRQFCNLTYILTSIFASLKVIKTMYTLCRLISNPFIRTSVRDSLPYSTKPKRVIRRYNRNNDTDPGIKQRKRLLRNTATAEELEEVDFDELESDFMNVHLSHKEFEEEVEARRDQERYFIVGQKYFKEKLPNFLTMNDKLQMKHLHRMDPEQWTVEKLSESFPALPYIISVSIVVDATILLFVCNVTNALPVNLNFVSWYLLLMATKLHLK